MVLHFKGKFFVVYVFDYISRSVVMSCVDPWVRRLVLHIQIIMHSSRLQWICVLLKDLRHNEVKPLNVKDLDHFVILVYDIFDALSSCY
jgi:hypothetical protein